MESPYSCRPARSGLQAGSQVSRTYAKVLVLEDDVEQRRELLDLVRRLGYLDPWNAATRTVPAAFSTSAIPTSIC